MHDEFCSTLTEKRKNILRVYMVLGGHYHKITEWHLYGSLTVFQDRVITWSLFNFRAPNLLTTNQSQHDLLYGGVSLSISLNLKLAPVPYATPKWPMSSWSGVLYCWACSEQFVSMLFEEKHWPSLFLPQTWMGIIFLTRICNIMCSEQCAIFVQIYILSVFKSDRMTKYDNFIS